MSDCTCDERTHIRITHEGGGGRYHVICMECGQRVGQPDVSELLELIDKPELGAGIISISASNWPGE